jgi:tripartite-type tricarboxylate transporter receptor subunit TctC
MTRLAKKSLLWAAMLALIGGAAAQTYPSRPITIIAPFPPGGPSDADRKSVV